MKHEKRPRSPAASDSYSSRESNGSSRISSNGDDSSDDRSCASRDARKHYPFLRKADIPGKISIKDRYFIIDSSISGDGLIGKGTFSQVVAGLDSCTGQQVAIKIFRAEEKYDDAASDEAEVLFHLESRASTSALASERLLSRQENAPYRSVSRQYHSQILSLYHFLVPLVNKFCFEQRHSALVFPRCGPNLLYVIEQLKLRRKALDAKVGLGSLASLRSLSWQLLRAVAHLHRCGVCHTDIKPENIVLSYPALPFVTENSFFLPNGLLSETSFRLIDLGNAVYRCQEVLVKENKVCQSVRNEVGPTIIQTRHYRAPEVIFGSGWSFPADLWSIGCVLYEAATGNCLFMTHEDEEHIALMAQVFGFSVPKLTDSDGGPFPFPSLFANGKFFANLFELTASNTVRLRWPHRRTRQEDIDFVERSTIPLRDALYSALGTSQGAHSFVDLISRLLDIDPKFRCTADQALLHNFFSISE